MTELYLGNNQIDSFGCQYLTHMLLNNQVIRSSFITFKSIFFQTLHTLMLANNLIEDQGAEFLAQALVINTVR